MTRQDDVAAAHADAAAREHGGATSPGRGVALLETLRAHLPPPAAGVVDVGGGTGQLAVRLAAEGHRVTVLDPSAAMLATCVQRAAEHGPDTSDRLATVQGAAEDAATLAGEGAADVVLCHEVLELVADPGVVVAALARVLRPGGVLSLVVANRAWLVLRAARRGEHAEALRLLDDPVVGRASALDAQSGALQRAYTPAELGALLPPAGLTLVSSYGLDVLAGEGPPRGEASSRALPEPERQALAELERRAAHLEPYRSVAELIHLVARLDR